MPDNEDMKQAAKEAIKEWLDEQVNKLGWWSIKTLAGLGLIALIYFILIMNGWKH